MRIRWQKTLKSKRLSEVRVNAAGTWRERIRTLTGEVSLAVSSAVVTTNSEKSAEAIVVKIACESRKERRAEQLINWSRVPTVEQR